MRTTKKWLAVLLSAFMVISSASIAFAEKPLSVGEAEMAGREVAYEASVVWHDSMLIPAEVNEIVGALFDALSVHGYYATPVEGDGYMNFTIMLSGQAAAEVSVVLGEEQLYIVSDLLPTPVTVRYDQMDNFINNIGSYVSNIMTRAGVATTPYTVSADTEGMEQMFGAVASVIAELPQPTSSDPQIAEMEMLDAIGLGEGTMAASAWMMQNAQPEELERSMGSVYGIKTESAIAYTITKDKIVDFMETIMPYIIDNDTYWSFVLSIANAMYSQYGVELTMEDLTEALPMVEQQFMDAAKSIPEGSFLRYTEGYDASGVYALSQIDLLVPGDEDTYSEEVVAYAEWVPETMLCYVEFFMGDEGVTFEVNPKPDTDAGDKDHGFTAVLNMMEGDQSIGQVVVQSSYITSFIDGVRVFDAGLMAGVVESSQEMGAEIVVHQEDSYTDDDIRKELNVLLNVLFGNQAMPIVEFAACVETKEPEGLPFDPYADSMSYADLGAMDESEFAEYMDNEVRVAGLRTVLRVMSLLPDEILSLLADEMVF